MSSIEWDDAGLTVRERHQAILNWMGRGKTPPQLPKHWIERECVMRFVNEGVRVKLPYTLLKNGEVLFDINAYADAMDGWPCYTCNAITEKHRLRCSGCRRVYYCSVECQHIDWPVHKPECKRFRQSNASKAAK